MKDQISALIRNAASFSEKEHQVYPSAFDVFGIGISSRYGKCDEIVQMLLFAQAAASSAVAHYVKEIDYDSKASICAFKLVESVVEGSEIEHELFAIAQRTISHFFWFDEEYFDDGTSGA
ncbi:MAG: hypothetical protein KGZ83_09845 [Sulfuricella sp.]|nr:hypothetical protein [Sulfuricella sp.]